MDFEAAIRKLQEVDIVSAAIQSRHEDRLKAHQEWLENQERWMTAHTQAMAAHTQAMAEFDRRLQLSEERHAVWSARFDEKMDEIEDKLNGLISVVDEIVRHRKNGHTE